MVSVDENHKSELEEYQKRVDMFLRLSATKVIGLEELDAEAEGFGLQSLEDNRLTVGTNVLLYGVPGSGKSWTIEHEYCKQGSKVERLVFHPDYTYSDFIGQILPNVAEDGQVSYEFTPGPFTNILKDAYNDPMTEYILIIEEINRGNAPAIFGEVFQLLDRKVEIDDLNDDGYPIGTSEYGITNANIAKIVYGDPSQKVRIPSNLSIIGTMNTSDQNVFTLDTAFQRRWDMRLIENNFDNVDPKLANAPILDTTVSWKNFCTEINRIVVGNNARMTSSEDKRLGAYFVHLRDLLFDDKMGDLSSGEYDDLRKKECNGTIKEPEKARLAEIREAMKQNRKFPEKVIKYLWDDAFKFNREVVFETTDYQSLEQVIRVFMYAKGLQRFAMFKENVRSAFTDDNQ
ncbi:MAG: AAA family ATPase [Lachnospiraceae bacterium]|nr:AAA family ATPase [Lachnospiraceae bacterium]